MKLNVIIYVFVLTYLPLPLACSENELLAFFPHAKYGWLLGPNCPIGTLSQPLPYLGLVVLSR